ncbi:hypothetical protein PUN28_009213 [Cardiocondyla obscurior]|uniref:Uncharacterized protein n=1 Tax=Cardiocondyla obscurior TaxID=286306 RepID=A0AAW2FTD5_9HYME
MSLFTPRIHLSAVYHFKLSYRRLVKRKMCMDLFFPRQRKGRASLRVEEKIHLYEFRLVCLFVPQLRRSRSVSEARSGDSKRFPAVPGQPGPCSVPARKKEMLVSRIVLRNAYICYLIYLRAGNYRTVDRKKRGTRTTRKYHNYEITEIKRTLTRSRLRLLFQLALRYFAL